MSDEKHASLPPWSEFRAALQAAGFQPTKSRGQNFLVDANMSRAIVRDAGVGEGDFVLEVGPGCGMLSVQLAVRGVRLLAVEVDARLARVAARFLEPYPRAEVLVTDVLATKHRLEPEVTARLPRTGPWYVVANLPYSIVGPLLVLLARLDHPPAGLTLLVQRELAERAAAAAGSPERGALSVKLQVLYDARVGRAVGRQLFRPRPRVESRVLCLERRARPPLELELFDPLVEGFFQQRRKRVGGVLQRLLGDKALARQALEEAGVDPMARPGALSVEDFLALSRHPAWRRVRGAGGPSEGHRAQEFP